MGGGANEYSLEEKVVGTWVDGKPLYQRTFYVETAVNDDVILASDIDIVFVISRFYRRHFSSDSFVVDGDDYWYGTNDYVNIRVAKPPNTNNIVLGVCKPNYTIKDLYITVQYTKTTD